MPPCTPVPPWSILSRDFVTDFVADLMTGATAESVVRDLSMAPDLSGAPAVLGAHNDNVASGDSVAPAVLRFVTGLVVVAMSHAASNGFSTNTPASYPRPGVLDSIFSKQEDDKEEDNGDDKAKEGSERGKEQGMDTR